MALSDKLTLAQYRTIVRRELMDTSAQWWTNAEINGYIQDWANLVQEDMALARGTAVATTGSATHTLTNLATDILRLDSVWWNNLQLSGRNEQDLNIMMTEWRNAASGTGARVAYMPDTERVVVWPPLSTTGTLEIEYVKKIALSSDAAVADLPGWIRWTCRPYVAYKCYLRHGPVGDISKAARYKARFLKAFNRAKELWANYMPTRTPRLKPEMSDFEIDILNPPVSFTVGTSTTTTTSMTFNDYTPTGDVNGTNTIFTLPVVPVEMQLFLNGQLMTPSVDYTLASSTITYVATSVPQTGDYQIAWVVRT